VTLFTFGAQSRACLATCDPRLAAVAEAALAASPYDFGIIEGHRSLDRQAYLFAEGKTRIDGVTRTGKYNTMPSRAFDFLPTGSVNGVPVWEDAQRFAVIAGAILATGNRLGIPLRWSGDWDGDGNARHQSLHDLPHIELVPTSN
jgi:peptidoglycan L-alanyl-D-glutamate endopeptidase CwlK